MASGRELISLVAERQDLDQFRRKNWEGSFEEYLDVVRADPKVTRNAFERVYDMASCSSSATTSWKCRRRSISGCARVARCA